MKKIIFLGSLLITIIACSPEATTNRKITGMWHLVSIDSKDLDSNYKEQIDFEPDGKGGTITETKTTNGIPVVTYGKYALIKSGSITISRTKSDSGYDDTGYDFVSITDNSITMKQNTNGNKVYVYKK